MKKKLFVVMTFATLGTTQLLAQGFYTEVNVGYGLSMASQEIDANYTNEYLSTSMSQEQEIVRGSYGAGLNFGIRPGYMISENLGFDLGVNYLLGQKIEATYSSYEETWGGGTFTENYTTTYQGKMLRINPSIVLSLNGDKVSPYARVGAILGFGSATQEMIGSDSDGYTSEFALIVNGGMSIGLGADLGVQYKLNDKLSILGTINTVSMSFAPKRGEITKYKENGVDYLNQLDKADREVEFVNSISYDSNTTYDPNSPSKELKMFMPFSSVGFNVGLRLTL